MAKFTFDLKVDIHSDDVEKAYATLLRVMEPHHNVGWESVGVEANGKPLSDKAFDAIRELDIAREFA